MEQPAPSTEYQPPLPPRETDESLTYNHEPLNPNKREIRLLEVLPGNDGDTIQCHLRVVNFADHPVYTALSYTWSNGNRSIHHIWIDGKMLQFGNNLWLFLQEFRKRKATDGVLLWVDAICIEQSNIQERNHQVAQMRDIYSTASSVIVWLGPCLDDDAHAFDLLRYSRRLLSIPKNQDPRRYRSHRQWNALASVFSKAYWERAWVIQEFLLAQALELWCGSGIAEWAAVENIFECLESCLRSHRSRHMSSSSLFRSRGYVFRQQRLDWKRKRSNLNLRSLIVTHMSTTSSDIRDKVYALLGLAYYTPENQQRISADYSKSNVGVLVDVVRDQCRGSSNAEIQDDHIFVDKLQRMFGVSNHELAIYGLRHAQDLPWLLSRDWFHREISTGLRCIGTVIESGFRADDEGLSSLDCFADRNGSNLAPYPFVNPEWLSSDNASVVKKLSRDPEVLGLLDIDVGHGKVKLTHRTSKPTTGAFNTASPSYPSSFQSSTNIFVGTNGVVGLTRGSVRLGDAICVFSNTSNNESIGEHIKDLESSKSDVAIITRDSSDRGGLDIVSIAKLANHMGQGVIHVSKMFTTLSTSGPTLLLGSHVPNVIDAFNGDDAPVHD